MTESTKKFALKALIMLTTLGFILEMLVYAQSKPEEQNKKDPQDQQSSTSPKEDAEGQQPTTNPPVDEQRIPSANALGSIFFESRNSLIFSLGAAQSLTNNLYFSGLSYGQFGNGSGYTGKYFPITSLTGRVAYQRELQKTTL